MRKLLFNYSFYSHPEIGNFRVWQKYGWNEKLLKKYGDVASAFRQGSKPFPNTNGNTRVWKSLGRR
jgi:hypothetical protein